MELSIFVRRLSSALRIVTQPAAVRRRARSLRASSSTVVDVLECRVLLTSDFGDAPDTSPGTGANNYQTLASNGGPSHVIDATEDTLFLGGGVDGEVGVQQSQLANRDDMFAAGGRDDEDGVLNAFDLTGTVGSLPSITLSATNTTATAATLFGWIDINHNGIFENATERTQVTVPAGTTAGKFTLTFPKLSNNSAGLTHARFRLSSDAAASSATGIATGGEVEDYPYAIRNRVNVNIPSVSTTRIAKGLNGGPNTVATDYFGFSATAIGDLDGNGTTDIAVGAPGDSSARGAVYVLYRNADGTIKSSVKIGSEINGGPTLSSGNAFGLHVESLGDVDGDGVTDLAVGSQDSNEVGAVYITRLKADGTAKSITKLASGTNGVPTLASGDSFNVVRAIGDVDGDGIGDLAVGTPGVDGAGTDRGAVYILQLNVDGTVRNSAVIVNSSDWNPKSADKDEFGQQIAALGDIDGDGTPDLAVMSDSSNSIGGSINLVHILRLNSDGSLKNSSQLPPESMSTPGVLANLTGVAGVGDIDGDGVSDLVVSGSSNPTGVVYEPNLEIVSLNADGSLKGKSRMRIPNHPVFGGMELSVLGNSGADGQLQLLMGMPLYFSSSATDPSVVVLTLASSIPNTTAPAIPQITSPALSTSSLRPSFTWVESARAS